MAEFNTWQASSPRECNFASLSVSYTLKKVNRCWSFTCHKCGSNFLVIHLFKYFVEALLCAMQLQFVLSKQNSLRWLVPFLLNEAWWSVHNLSMVGIFNGSCVILLEICLISYLNIDFTIWRIERWLPSLNLMHNQVMKYVWKHYHWAVWLSHYSVLHI